jgi:two-component system phosphate regulon sensor histidine kinase PhoR
MTHEFKTPVTNIGIAGQILKSKAHEGTQVYVDILLKENEKLRQKIDQVLLGASVDGLRKPVFETLDIHQLIQDCAEAFSLKLQERDGNLTLHFSASDPQIIGDRELLAQAISNVIDNAEKYSRHAPKILVRTKDTTRGLEIDIVDEGIGIEPAMMKKVFDKFFRVPSGDVHNVKGFGLGLNFVKQVIKSHRGDVNLFSTLNKGTEVKIFLPKL